MRVANETISIFQNDTLSHSSSKVYSACFPMTKEAWHRLRLILELETTIGTGTGAIALGEYKYLKNIILRNSDGELIVSTPAPAFYWLNYLLYGEEPNRSAFTAADGTYRAIVDIPFALPFLARPEDTIIDSGRYSSFELEITSGSLSDLLTSAGTAAVTPKLSLFLERSKAGYSASGKPLGGYPIFRTLAPALHTAGYIPFESSEDLVYFGFFIHSATSPTSGVPYSGTSADDIKGISFGDSLVKFLQNLPVNYFKEMRKKLSGADLTGIYPYHFVNDGSMFSSYRSGNVGEVRFEWSGYTTGGQETAFVYGFRKFKRS